MGQQTVYLFDVDGVLTDPVAKQVTETELFSVLIVLLKRGDLVGLNTGRSIRWIQERVFGPLLAKLESKKLFTDVIGVGEKGGTWVTFDAWGKPQHGKDKRLAISEVLHDQIQQLVEEKYQDAMFFDDTKETMISIEMHDGYSLTAFHTRQKEFVKEVKSILSQKGFAEQYTIDPSTIATDIEEKHAGKALGVDRLLTLLTEKGIHPSTFITFGDSYSDLAMADELHARRKDVTFVYTGERKKLGTLEKSYLIAFAAGYTQGTLAFLKNRVTILDESRTESSSLSL